MIHTGKSQRKFGEPGGHSGSGGEAGEKLRGKPGEKEKGQKKFREKKVRWGGVNWEN